MAPLKKTSSMFVTRTAAPTVMRRVDSEDIEKAVVKKDPDAMAKDVKRSMESDGTKLYAGGVNGSYSAFLIFHRNLETSMGDMHPDMAELINIDPDVDPPLGARIQHDAQS